MAAGVRVGARGETGADIEQGPRVERVPLVQVGIAGVPPHLVPGDGGGVHRSAASVDASVGWRVETQVRAEVQVEVKAKDEIKFRGTLS